MSPCSSNNCELITSLFKDIIREIESSDARRFSPNKSLSLYYIGQIRMLVKVALKLPLSEEQAAEIIHSTSQYLQRTGGVELLVPLAAKKGSLSTREFLYEVLLTPKTRFPLFYNDLIPYLEELAGGKLKDYDLSRVCEASIGGSDWLKVYQEQQI